MKDKFGNWGLVDANYYEKMDKQQGPTLGTENYTRYPVINHNGKENEKESICLTESLCWTAEINTTL